MIPHFLQHVLDANRDAEAIASGTHSSTYGDLLCMMNTYNQLLTEAGVRSGSIVSIEGDYSADLVGALLSCIHLSCIVVPLSSDSSAHLPEFLQIGEVEFRVDCQRREVRQIGAAAHHDLFRELRQRATPGLVLFSSGSSGRHKGAVHDLQLLLQKFAVPRHRYRTLVFLQPDHIGGLNTLFYTLSNVGTIVVAPARSPDAVAAAIQRHRVELLPTSPTFLNLLMMSGAADTHDLSSLQLITYGTEPMPQSTLTRVAERLPGVRLLQTYGMTELGILRSQSRDQDSLWIRVGGEGYQTRVVDGRLQVKAASAMLGYLNAPSPFTADGYFETGDRVEVSGEWLRILGRDSEVINVGGSKVYPAEIEDVILRLSNVIDAAVYGQPNPITGQAVACTVRLATDEPLADFKTRLRRHCLAAMPSFKVPVRVKITTEPLHSSRFKRMRRSQQSDTAGAANG